MSEPSTPAPLSASPYHWSNYAPPPLPIREPAAGRKRRLWPWIVAALVIMPLLFVLGVVCGAVAYRDLIAKAQDHTLAAEESKFVDDDLATVTPEQKTMACQAIAKVGEDETR